MKAISIKQPWTDLIMRGIKTIELRSWRTHYRGPLVLCVSASPKINNLPTGIAIETFDLVDIRPSISDDIEFACLAPPENCFSWIIENPVFFKHPWPVKGRLMLFDMPIIQSSSRPRCAI